MADQATLTLLWARKVKLESSGVGGIEIGVRVRNSGDVSWGSSLRSVRGHVITPDGTFFRDVSVSNAPIAQVVAPGAEVVQTVIYRSAGWTPSLSLASLYHPDTTVIVDVCQEGVGWIGRPNATLYARDADRATRDVLTQASRVGLLVQPSTSVAIPTSGSPAALVDLTVPDGQTYYVQNLILTVSTGTRSVSISRTPAGGSLTPLSTLALSSTSSLTVPLNFTKLAAGDRFLVQVLVNASGGTAYAQTSYVALPWAE